MQLAKLRKHIETHINQSNLILLKGFRHKKDYF